jgi:peptidoglycan/xylan/chitin deacetylase (PgdA/CDA1 family)
MRISLTVDVEHPDYPTTNPLGNASRLLDLLRDREIRSSFFVQSSWANAYPDLAVRIADEGHLIGSHSHWHCVFPSMNDEGIAADLAESRQILDAISPTNTWFRLPGGRGADDPRIRAAVLQAGYDHVGWTCGLNDWEPGIGPEQVAFPMIEHARSSAVPVIVPVLHSWPDPTCRAVEIVLDALADDAEFVRLDQIADHEVPR